MPHFFTRRFAFLGVALVLLALTGIAITTAQATSSGQVARGVLRLVDNLDRPQDGYCLDIAGSGPWVDISVPLSAHNCKGREYGDQMITYNNKSGRIRFPDYRVCLTALGRAGRSLELMPLIVRQCVEEADAQTSPFVGPAVQSFFHRPDGRVELGQSGLCLAVGPTSDTTFSPADKWRALYLDRCEQIPASRSVWRPIPSPAA